MTQRVILSICNLEKQLQEHTEVKGCVLNFRLFIWAVTLTFDLHRLHNNNLDESCGSWCPVHSLGKQN